MDWWKSPANRLRNTPKKKQVERRKLGCAVAAYWSDEEIQYVKRIRRRNDRLIAKWLWLTFPVLRQSDIARKLGISRSAVSQRKYKIQSDIIRKFHNIYMGEYGAGKMLNVFPSYDIYNMTEEEEW